MSGFRVGVFGANGHTGRFVAAELARRGLRTRLIGRNHAGLSDLQSKLGGGELRTVSVEDYEGLIAAFQGLDAVINCAGPFFDTCRPVHSAALAVGCHSLDVTAEQVTVLDTIATFDQPAKAAGRVVMPAAAFFGGLADLLATRAADRWSAIDTIDIAVALSSWHPTSGTRLTGQRNTAPRIVVRSGQLSPVPSPPPTGDWRFPEPFGSQTVTCVALSEIILLSRHLPAHEITSYMTLKPLADLADQKTPSPRATDPQGRSDQMFAISVRVTQGSETREATATGQDIYAVTAPIVVEAAVRLMSVEAAELSGVRSPGEIFDPTEFLAALEGVLRVELHPSNNSTD